MGSPVYLFTHHISKHIHLCENLIALLYKHGINTYGISGFTDALNLKPMPLESIDKGTVICIGGDGTLLSAAKYLVASNAHILGINAGTIGFLADTHSQDLSKVLNAVQGDASVEKRHFLQLSASQGTAQDSPFICVNEVSITRQGPHILRFTIYANDEAIATHHADGVMVSTPTGSTAYNLSAGGPIVHPESPVYIINPICTHKLTSRPFIVPDHTRIRIHVHEGQTQPMVCLDGIEQSHPIGTDVVIEKSTRLFTMLHPNDYSFYRNLQSKLQWETRHAG